MAVPLSDSEVERLTRVAAEKLSIRYADELERSEPPSHARNVSAAHVQGVLRNRSIYEVDVVIHVSFDTGGSSRLFKTKVTAPPNSYTPWNVSSATGHHGEDFDNLGRRALSYTVEIAQVSLPDSEIARIVQRRRSRSGTPEYRAPTGAEIREFLAAKESHARRQSYRWPANVAENYLAFGWLFAIVVAVVLAKVAIELEFMNLLSVLAIVGASWATLFAPYWVPYWRRKAGPR